ncbi:nonribosomal peptide synthetase DhbF [Myxococcaceae bacterium]|nr:nonribosomal peptide synthetase DhbF [Myxococcaceae bacterium]
MSVYIENKVSTEKTALSASKRAVLEKRLQGKASPSSQFLPLARIAASEAPLSFAQQRLWFLDQLEPDSAFYNLCSALRISGRLDSGALEAGINQVIRRHEILRTAIPTEDGRPRQVIAGGHALAMPVLDISGLPAHEREAALAKLISAEAGTPFDIAVLPLLRAKLIRLGETEHVLVVAMHHIISDGWSMGVFIRECSGYYRGFAEGVEFRLPELPVQYADFAHWQRQALTPAALGKPLEYWRRALRDAPELLDLPFDRPRPAVQGYRGAACRLDLPGPVAARLREIGRASEATLFMTLLALFGALLARYSGQTDFCVGTPVANRNRGEIEGLIGFFVNTLVLRIDLSGNPAFTELLRRVRELTLAAQTHQEVPFEALVDELRPARDASRNPFFQVMFALQNAASERYDLPGLSISPLRVETQTAQFDLSLDVAEAEEGLRLSFEYNSDLFDAATVAGLGRHFLALAERVAADPGRRLWDLPLLDEAEQRAIVAGRNRTERDEVRGRLFQALFEEQVRRDPGRVAVEFRGQRLSYGELNRRANAIAHALLARGVGVDTLVAVADERGCDLLAMILGVFKAGGGYLPLDPRHPPARLAQILGQSGTRWVLAGDGLLPVLRRAVAAMDGGAGPELLALSALHAESGPEQDPPLRARPDSLAYVIYTSGSTGVPKGAMVDQRGMLNNVWSKRHWLGLGQDDVVAQTASQCFDISVWQFLSALLFGAKVHIFPDAITGDPAQWLDAVEEHGVTVMEVVPSLLGGMVEVHAAPPLSRLRWVLPTGEELPPGLCRDWFRRFPQIPLLNAYGPAECADDVALHPLTRAPADGIAHVPIGRPNDNIRLYVLNAAMQPQPVGVTGELCVGGVGVGRGYLNDPARTAESFVPDPFGEPGGRLYKTGDLAKLLADGDIEFLGRVDHQVKIRGFRIELGEIEARLLQHPAIREAVVLAREDRPGQKRLVAYLVGDGPEPDRLREFLKDTLPEYMVPAFFVALANMPLNENGKVDRKSLPVPAAGDGPAGEYVAPRNDREAFLADIWREVLGLERVGVHDNFFEIGGESVIAIQVVSRANRAGIAIKPRQLFQHQTVAELAEALAKEPFAAPSPAADGEAAVEPFALAELDCARLERLRAGQPDIEDIYPLTPMQEGMLFHSLLNPGSGVYVMQDRFLLQGALDVAAFREAWRAVVGEQVILRTAYLWEEDTRPHQMVHARLELPLDYHDWRGLDGGEQGRRIEAMLEEELRQGVDLGKPPLFRIRLVALRDETHLFEFSHHHSLLDDWSASSLLADFYAHYEEITQHRELSRRPHPPYRNYIAWLQAQDPAAAEAYWRQELRGFRAPTPLMADRPPRELAADEIEVADLVVKLSAADTAALCALAQQHQLTPNTFVQGSWGLLLSHYSGQEDVLFGVTVVGRPPHLAGMESMVGLFINGLPLRVGIDLGSPLLAWLRQIFDKNLEMREYEYSPLVQIQEWSELPRGQQLFFSLITYENAPVDDVFKQGNLKFQVADSHARVHTNYPLTLVILPGAEFSLRLSYDRRRFDEATVAAMLGHFQTLLEGMIHRPDCRVGELAWLTAGERRQILEEWNRTGHPYPEPRDLVARFERQAEETPESIAVACGGERLSYAELNTRANRMAHVLAGSGIGPDVIVALLDDRGAEFLTMMLAVFKAGGAYLPLEPAHPNARLTQVLEESGVRFVLAGTDYQARGQAVVEACAKPPALLHPDMLALGAARAENPPPRHSGRNLAFIIFTSGSTGTPKGAMVEFQGMYNNLITKVPVLGLTGADTIAQTASQCFDISVWQFLTALTCGARVEVFPDAVTHDPYALLRRLEEREVTVLEAVPSMIRALLDAADEGMALPRLRWLLPCGEVFPPELCRRWMARFPQVRLLNAYGPAECSDDVSYHPITEPPTAGNPCVPVGRPVDNTRIYLLNRWLEPVPVGVPGEICVAGVQVGRGYLNRPAITAGVFIPDPFGEPGERLYRTGDLARYRADGVLEFLGRADYQVKIRGFRIELGEIEARLSEHPAVKAVAAIVRDTARGDKELVAYVEGAPGEAPERGELREFLKEVLPDYMVPPVFVFPERLPVTDNGKVDRKNLPVPDLAEQVAEHYTAPRDPTEERLARVWGEALGLSRIGVHDNFFELGGHSLLAVKLLAKLREEFQIDLSLRSLFDCPTVAAQANLLATGGWRDLPDEEAVDLAAEAVLDPAIRPAPRGPEADLAGPKAVFLTGGTGFLGAFLIHELASSTGHTLHCLVRQAKTDAEALDRLRAGLARYGLWHDALAGRLVPVRGDLSEPLLGLGEERFDALARRIDAIYHCGAAVNDVASYRFLKPANVLGTREVLRLACRHRPKRVNYVSSTAVFGKEENPRPSGFVEDEFPGAGAEFRDGYDQTKWVAESLVKSAGRRGLPVSIYRPAFVVGHSGTGAWNTGDAVCRLLKGSIEMGLAPEEDIRFDMVPVDYVSKAIVFLSEREQHAGGVFHLTNPHLVSTADAIEWINGLGYPLKKVPMRQWRQEVVKTAKRSPEFALYPMAPIFEDDGPAEDGAAEVAHTFDCRQTLGHLGEGNLDCPVIALEQMRTYFRYFEQAGFLGQPGQASGQPR